MSKPKQELAVQNDSQLAAADAFDLFESMGAAGLENVGANEITLPQLKIMQPTSPMVADGKATPGQIVNSMTEEVFGKEMTFVPLFFFVTRLKFRGTELNSGIECSSRDGRTGSLTDEFHGGGNCLVCPHAQWTRNPGGQDKGPECIELKNILAIPLTGDNVRDNVPGVFAAKRKAIVPINKFLTRASLLRVNGKPVPFFGSKWTVKSVLVKNDKGSFYVPEFQKADYVAERDELVYFHDQYKALKATQSQFVIHDNDRDETADIPQTTEY